MAHSLIMQVSNNLLVRTVAVTIVIMCFFGVATGALPVRCWIGGDCPAVPGAVAVTETPASPAPTKAVVMPAAQLASEPAVKAIPTLTQNEVIAKTFAQLKVELQPPTVPETIPVQVASAVPPAKTVTNPETGLSKRVVRAITVRADGTPDLGGTVAEAYADPRASASVVPPSPAVDAAARIAAGQMPLPVESKVAELTPSPKASATKTASPSAGTATVLGQGANIRANPSKSGGKVLFALRGGEKVTIIESKRGWLRIKDDQGRTGWIYSDGVKRG